MFVQVIKGHTSDPAAIREKTEQWRDEVRPGAKGFLGATSGVADDGTVFAVVRFEDEASATANSERPEQTAWWAEMAKLYDDDPVFENSSDISTLFDGGSDGAGFVQVMESQVKDRARLEEMESVEMLEGLRNARPDLIGGLRVWLPGDRTIEVAFFTSEAEARANESSDAFDEPRESFDALFEVLSYTDLRDPILTS